MSNITDSPLLLKARTGGLSLFALMLLLGGIGCAILQVGLLTGGRLLELEPAARYLPGALALAFLAMFWLKGLRRGDIAIHVAGIAGRTKNGRRFAFKWSAIADIDLRSHHIILRDAQGKTLLADSPPNQKALRGLIWLHLHHELSQEVWLTFVADKPSKAVTATRQFLDADGNPVFLDLGFVFEIGGEPTFLPESDTVPIPQKIAGDQSLSTTLMPSGMLLKFEPNPAKLPIRQLNTAIISTPMEEKLRNSALHALCEKHGGAFLTPKAKGWTGETAGWKIQVHPIDPN